MKEKLTRLSHVPVIAKDLADVQVLEVAIIEKNIRKANLNVLEEGEAYYRLIQEFHYTQEKVAEKIGKSRSTIANLLRLRKLPQVIKEGIINERIAMGHARALLGVEHEEIQIRLFRKVVQKHLSVRETELLVSNTKKINANIQAEDTENGSEKQFLAQASALLSERIKFPVNIRKKGEKGKIEFTFKTQNELQNLIRLLSSL
jgi:ParB family transcriptional regulator, chromosome partitioning protein